MTTRLCISCRVGEAKLLSDAPVTLQIAGHDFQFRLPGWVCSRCKETSIRAEGLEAAQHQIAKSFVESGTTSPAVFKWLRRAVLCADAIELAKLLDVHEATVSRWETGKVPIPRAVLATLGSLVLDELSGKDDTLKRLQTLASPQEPCV